ncbi:hypothetical protein GGX14DRAFT_596168, partial [Mycena pura]
RQSAFSFSAAQNVLLRIQHADCENTRRRSGALRLPHAPSIRQHRGLRSYVRWRGALNVLQPPRAARTCESRASIPPAVPARAQPSAVWIRTQRAQQRKRARAAFALQLNRRREPVRAAEHHDARLLFAPKQLPWRPRRRAGRPGWASASVSVAQEWRVSADKYPPHPSLGVVSFLFRIRRRERGAARVGAECPRQWQVHPPFGARSRLICPARYYKRSCAAGL